MRTRDLFLLASDAPRRHRLRSALSLTGIAIGVAAVLALTSLGEAARTYVEQEFIGLGSNIIAVLPGKVETTGAIGVFGGTTHDLTIDDALALQRRSAALLRAAPVALGEATIEFRNAGRTVPIIGSTNDYLAIRDFKVSAGSALPAGDPHRGERVCLIGRVVQARVFGDTNPLGATVRIGDWRFRVIGILESKGKFMGVDMDDVVVVPVRTAMRMFDRTSLFRIIGQARGHTNIAAAREEMRAVLIDRHEGEEDFTLILPDAMLAAFGSILTALTAALGAIAGISLFVAGIGIMNVMLVSVSERTQEIGLLKAFGARGSQVMRLFLTEAALLTVTGSVLGVGLGLAAVGMVSAFLPELPARVHAVWLLCSVAIAMAVGMVFGVLPARRAASVEPVQALSGKT